MARLALDWIKIWITQIDSVYRPCTARGLRSIDSIDESRGTNTRSGLSFGPCPPEPTRQALSATSAFNTGSLRNRQCHDLSQRGSREPGGKHWHGAAATTAMIPIAIEEQLDGKTVDCMNRSARNKYRASPGPDKSEKKRSISWQV